MNRHRVGRPTQVFTTAQRVAVAKERSLKIAVDALNSVQLQTATIIEVDVGSKPAQSGSFEINVLPNTVGANVRIEEDAAVMSNGELGDRLECEQLRCRGIVASAETVVVYWTAAPGYVAGLRRFTFKIDP